VKTATNKRLLISESHDDSNRCTPYRGKLDQHTTRIPRSVCIWSQTIRILRDQRIVTIHGVVNRVEQGHCSRKRTPDPIHSTTADRSTGLYPIFLPRQLLKQWEQSQPSIDDRLLGLPGSYLRHVIDTFNTCSHRSIHRSLIDTSGGYNLRGVDFPHTTTRLTQPAVSTFHLRVLPGFQFNQKSTKVPKLKI
jgi:hypothetical protein